METGCANGDVHYRLFIGMGESQEAHLVPRSSKLFSASSTHDSRWTHAKTLSRRATDLGGCIVRRCTLAALGQTMRFQFRASHLSPKTDEVLQALHQREAAGVRAGG